MAVVSGQLPDTATLAPQFRVERFQRRQSVRTPQLRTRPTARRLFSTLEPRLLHWPATPAFGVTGFRGPRYTRPHGALLLPFVMWRDGRRRTP